MPPYNATTVTNQDTLHVKISDQNSKRIRAEHQNLPRSSTVKLEPEEKRPIDG